MQSSCPWSHASHLRAGRPGTDWSGVEQAAKAGRPKHPSAWLGGSARHAAGGAGAAMRGGWKGPGLHAHALTWQCRQSCPWRSRWPPPAAAAAPSLGSPWRRPASAQCARLHCGAARAGMAPALHASRLDWCSRLHARSRPARGWSDACGGATRTVVCAVHLKALIQECAQPGVVAAAGSVEKLLQGAANPGVGGVKGPRRIPLKRVRRSAGQARLPKEVAQAADTIAPAAACSLPWLYAARQHLCDSTHRDAVLIMLGNKL